MSSTSFTATLRLQDRFSTTLRAARSSVSSFSTTVRGGGDSAKRFGDKLRGSGRDADQASRSWDQARSRLERFSHGFQKAEGVINRFTRGVRQKLRWAFYGLNAGITAFVGAGVKFNSTFENSITSFETFLGSAKKAEAYIEKLRGVSRTSTMRLTDFMQNARLMLGFGAGPDQAVKVLRALSDAIAATGGDQNNMNSASRAIGQIIAKGRIQAEEMMQLTEAGIPVQKILQRELKLTGEQVGDIGKQNISATRAVDALVRGWSKQFGGASLRNAKTFSGQVSILRKDFEFLARMASKPLFEFLRVKVLPGLSSITTKLGDVWSDKNKAGLEQKLSQSWAVVTSSFDSYLDGGGAEEIARAGERFGELLGKGVMLVFSSNKTDNPFVEAGRMALGGFWRGFISNVNIPDILTSPLGRAIEAYFLLKWGPRLGVKLLGGILRGKAGGGGILGKAGSALTGPTGAATNPFFVVPLGSGLGGPRGPGGIPPPIPGPKGKPGQNPYPAPTTTKGPGNFKRGVALASKWSKRFGPVMATFALYEYMTTGSMPDPMELLGFQVDSTSSAQDSPKGDAAWRNSRVSYKRNLRDLNARAEAGVISPSGYLKQKRELEKRLNEDTHRRNKGTLTGDNTSLAYYRPGKARTAEFYKSRREAVDPAYKAYRDEMREKARARERARLARLERERDKLSPKERRDGLLNTEGGFPGVPSVATLTPSDIKPNKATSSPSTKGGDGGLDKILKRQAATNRKQAQVAAQAQNRAKTHAVATASQTAQSLVSTVGPVVPTLGNFGTQAINRFTAGIKAGAAAAAKAAGAAVDGARSAVEAGVQNAVQALGGVAPTAPGAPSLRNPQGGVGGPSRSELSRGGASFFDSGATLGKASFSAVKPPDLFGGLGGTGQPGVNAGAIIGTPYGGTHTLGNWQSDNALDISLPIGTPLQAYAAGTVTKISPGSRNPADRFAGDGVTITGPRGGIFYKHLFSTAVRVGQQVGAGQIIGSSGSANSVPHLHVGFEPPQSPYDYVPKKHGGGIFRAPSKGGEGLALLRDGERVIPASGAGSGGGSGVVRHVHTYSGTITVQGTDGTAIKVVMEQIANELRAQALNTSTVEVG